MSGGGVVGDGDLRGGGRPRSVDAVVVVPGIMGSELVDAAGVTRWGLKPAVLAGMWATGRLDELLVTPEDVAGWGRLRATRLLRVPAFLPVLRGLEPYTRLLRRVASTVVDRRAVAEFAYDWRLSIEFNAGLMVARCGEHLDRWRQVVREQRYGDPAQVCLVVVAHSMGGLVTRYACEVLGLSELVTRMITLGTPYYGAVKAFALFATGRGARLPQTSARQLALSCPGVYDLLPRYRCVRDAAGGDARRLTVGDVVGVGGSARLSQEAAARWDRLGLARPPSPGSPVLNALVGAEQPTEQAIEFGERGHRLVDCLDGVDHGGDSTVYRGAAAPTGVEAFPLPQKHGALATCSETLTFVADKLIGADSGPPLGTRPVGVDIPDLAPAGDSVTVGVRVEDGSPVGVTVRSIDLATGKPTTWRDRPTQVDGQLLYIQRDLGPGLHRVEVTAGGYSPVSDLLLVTP